MRQLTALLADESGLSMVEYGIIAAGLAAPMIAIGAIIATRGGNDLVNLTANFNQIGLSPP